MVHSLNIEDLLIINHLKTGDAASVADTPGCPGTFRVETCQRVLHVLPGGTILRAWTDRPAQIVRGVQAYRMLLRIATGLESQVAGETEVFGQLKNAWQSYQSGGGKHARNLSSMMQKLLEDVKDIRSACFSGSSTASYGNIVRSILKKRLVESPGPVLVVGAGGAALSVAEALSGNVRELLLWNRSRGRLDELAVKIRKMPSAGKTRVIPFFPPDEEAAWSGATHVVVCIPLDPVNDAARIEHFKKHDIQTLVHLGCTRGDAGGWKKIQVLLTLDDVFELRGTNTRAKVQALATAERLCDERARLRSLGGSITTPHGWEDLVQFQ